MKTTCFVTMAVLIALEILPAGAALPATNQTAKIEVVRKVFLGLHRPLAYTEYQGNSSDPEERWFYFRVGGDAAELITQTDKSDLAWALWPFLDDPKWGAEATILLYTAFGIEKGNITKLTYHSPANPGNWGKIRKEMVSYGKCVIRRAFNQPDWWYPHQVLFDRETVLAESKTNALVRAAYVAAMQKALVDPKIRTENPLEVESILQILSALNAKEAAATFAEYMFYDSSVGKDYRIPPEGATNGRWDPKKPHKLGLPILWYLPRLGETGVPFVLEKLAKTTPEERSENEGGGAATILPMFYFIAIGYSEEQAVKAIDDFKNGRPNITTDQINALNELRSVITDKKHRPEGFRSSGDRIRTGWAAPISTNAPPAK